MKKATTATVPMSCSNLFNNLASGRTHTGYVHHNSVCVIPDSAVTNGSTSATAGSLVINEPDGAQIQQIRWVQLNAGELLVVASMRSLQLYTPDGKRLLHVVTAGVPSGEPPATYRGIASCSTGQVEYVCGGCSTGAICIIPLSPGSGHTFVDPLLSPASTLEIVDITAGPAPPNDTNRALVCSADAQGDVHVHALEADRTWSHSVTFPFMTSDETPALCTSLRLRGQRLYCAYSTGHVRIFDVMAGLLSVSVAAHARWINALEAHPCRDDLFVTASEDTTLGVWKLIEPEGKVVHVAHIPVQDWLLTGVSFAGGTERTHLAASAYDQALIQSWRCEKM